MLSRRIALCVVATPMAILLTAPTASAARVGDFNAVAHRGYHRHHTENTLGALRAARRAGATGMETDVRITRDGHFVVMHDPRLRRTTTCRGAVARHTRHWIRHHCRAEDGSRIPTAEEMLHAAHRANLNLMLDLKTDPRHRWTKHRFRMLKRTIFAHHMQDRVMLISRGSDRLRKAEAVAPGLKTMWISKHAPSVRSVHRRADEVSVLADVISRRYVNRMNDAGIRVYGRRNNRPHAWHRFQWAGVAGTITDAIRRFTRWESR
jgi:glycerophosphoryl diester phosphodiesterase